QQAQGDKKNPQDQQQGQTAGANAGELTPEEAERLLDAMKAGEIASQKRKVLLKGNPYRGNEW
ncbi:MAG: hypothetical protein CME25_21945, partial [Gemmatimonadetes bacterium]|nr:hypothetical protein [Gemmatimonadota bacterium]